jgi:hypothetical protein
VSYFQACGCGAKRPAPAARASLLDPCLQSISVQFRHRWMRGASPFAFGVGVCGALRPRAPDQGLPPLGSPLKERLTTIGARCHACGLRIAPWITKGMITGAHERQHPLQGVWGRAAPPMGSARGKARSHPTVARAHQWGARGVKPARILTVAQAHQWGARGVKPARILTVAQAHQWGARGAKPARILARGEREGSSPLALLARASGTDYTDEHTRSN